MEPDIFVLELGIGVGLFARFFLDHFQVLCKQQGRDFYARLTYIAADRSERMLKDVIRHGVLANHPGRYLLRPVDAMCPEKDLPRDACFREHPRRDRPFRAVFLNYLLDCLPASVLQFEEKQVLELHVRTCVARNIRLNEFTDLSLEQLKERVASTKPRAKQADGSGDQRMNRKSWQFRQGVLGRRNDSRKPRRTRPNVDDQCRHKRL